MGILRAAWTSLGEDPAALASVRPLSAPVPLDSVLPIGELVHDSVAAASLSAALLTARRQDAAAPAISLDPARLATAVTSERHFRLRGEPMNPWAELSGFWPTLDGWVRTHANYPHHRARLLAALGLDEPAPADDLAAAIAQRTTAELEETVSAAGGIATAVRSEAQWREHPQSAAVAAQPLIRVERVGEGAPAPLGPGVWDAPARGIRVLDLTRVIAGPVAARTLALWGADVLRVDPPTIPEIAWQHLDTGAGKRSVVLAADDPRFRALLATADVVICGYRPGSLDRLGLGVLDLAREHPGLVVAQLSAWGTTGPLAGRRGFDSIVQAASGIAMIEGADGSRPGALPAQVLDHGAGYLLAAGITTALRRRADEGGTWLVETSLARVAQELLAQPRAARLPAAPWNPTVLTYGEVTVTAPAPGYEQGPSEWASGPVRWGSSQPEWSSSSTDQ